MIKKLEINLFPESSSKDEYERAKRKYIAEYTEYHPGGLFSISHEIHNPAAGEADWNNDYPNGYASWAGRQQKLTAYGEQQLIDKINEIIVLLSKDN